MSEHEGIWTEYRPTYCDGWSACKRMGDLVRCRDCAGFEDDGYDETICHFAAMVKPNKDDFCSYGERRDA